MTTALVRPRLIYAWKGPCVFIATTRGDAGESEALSGYYFREARFLRTCRLELDGTAPWLCESAAVAPDTLDFASTHPEVAEHGGGGSGQSADYASPLMYVIALANLYSWTGDEGVLSRHWDTARRILDWARDRADLDGDGYLEYQTRSTQGTKNQGWKDSGDAIIYDDGTPVPSPIAEQATILFGLRRFGFDARMHDLATALFELAQLYPEFRIPECVGGYARAEYPTPGAYPQANTPQLWNATAFPLLVQTILGLLPLATYGVLVLDPALPDWLPELVMHDLRVGGATVTLRFWRKPSGESQFEVIPLRGALRILRQPPPESLSAGLADRFGALVETVLH